MTGIDAFVLALAIWRVASLLANENGPGDVFDKLRTKLGVEVDTYGKHGTTTLSKLIVCVWCSSVWFGLFAAVAYYLAPRETVWVALVFALSAGAVLVEETLDKIMRE